MSVFKRHQKRASLSSHAMEQQFIDAYNTYADLIFRHCALRIGNRETGKDVMQEAFLKTWEYLVKGKQVDNLKAFLYKTANNLLVDYARRKKRRTEDSLEAMQEEAGFDLPDEEPGPGHRYAQREVLETVQKIEEPYRTAVIMRYVDGLPPREIAELLHVSSNVASVHVHRGLEQLTSLLRKHDG